MAQVRVTFSGGVVADPEEIAEGRGKQFPVYVNHSRKDKDTGEYVPTGDTTKIRVTLWGDLKDEDIRKGDIVEVEGSLVEKEFSKQDGTQGRALQTEFVNSVVVKFRKDNSDTPVSSNGFASTASAAKGF